MPCSTATSTALLLCKVLLLYVQKAECATAAGGVIRGGGVYKTGMKRASERRAADSQHINHGGAANLALSLLYDLTNCKIDSKRVMMMITFLCECSSLCFQKSAG
jgi:hypothetical protein